MLRRILAGLGAGLLALVAACGETPSGLESPDLPAFNRGGTAACPTPADLVATDEASLLAALAAASSGDVIGLDGMIEITHDVIINFFNTEPNLTLTCVTPRSGLRVAPGSFVLFLLQVVQDGVVVERLKLDASQTLWGAVWAGTGISHGLVLAGNDVTCGRQVCAFILGNHAGQTGGPATVIVDNTFTSSGSITGVHLQGGSGFDPDFFPIDGTVIQRNTVIATAPSVRNDFGGLRVRDGRNVIISDNDVRGPWQNSMSLTNLGDSEIERNQLHGAVNSGVATSFGQNSPFGPLFMLDNVFRNNLVRGAGVDPPVPPFMPPSGMFMDFACGNTLLGNNLQGNLDDVAAFFDEMSGANTMVGNGNVAIDNGDWDCDGDLVSDPNVITGTGPIKKGTGQTVGDAASGTGGGGKFWPY